MLTILMPCAGEGRRFREAGYTCPKPLIDLHGNTMIQRVIENLAPENNDDCRWLFVTQDGVNIAHAASRIKNYHVHRINEKTDGAARTCLKVKHLIDTSWPLLIANCDQLVLGLRSGDKNRNVADILPRPNYDASVLTFKGDGSKKWSYVSVHRCMVEKIAEKEPISDRATCGYYWFRRGKDFVAAAEKMIAANDRVNNEFYVAPVLNWLIAEGLKVREVRVEDYKGEFVGLGTPEDVKTYLEGM